MTLPYFTKNLSGIVLTKNHGYVLIRLKLYDAISKRSYFSTSSSDMPRAANSTGYFIIKQNDAIKNAIS